MKWKCPNINCPTGPERPDFDPIVRKGFFYRESSSRFIQRFLCKNCGKRFSTATFNPCYRQKKRRLNPLIRRLLCSGVSQRRIALLLGISRLTVERKFLFLSDQALLSYYENLK